MNDTPPEVDALYQRLLMERSGLERLRMASDMFDFARECALAGLRSEGVTDPVELQAQLYRRLHGAELPAAARALLEARLRER